MSMFENSGYRWRETYFVQFDSKNRPSLRQLQKTLCRLSNRFTLTNLAADKEGCFESLTLLSPDDYAALDICYLHGAEVMEQAAQFAEEMTASGCAAEERARLDQIRRYDARFDVLHFEQILDDEDDMDETLDPSALLLVLAALAELTHGIAVDPQTGTLQ